MHSAGELTTHSTIQRCGMEVRESRRIERGVAGAGRGERRVNQGEREGEDRKSVV